MGFPTSISSGPPLTRSFSNDDGQRRNPFIMSGVSAFDLANRTNGVAMKVAFFSNPESATGIFSSRHNRGTMAHDFVNEGMEWRSRDQFPCRFAQRGRFFDDERKSAEPDDARREGEVQRNLDLLHNLDLSCKRMQFPKCMSPDSHAALEYLRKDRPIKEALLPNLKKLSNLCETRVDTAKESDLKNLALSLINNFADIYYIRNLLDEPDSNGLAEVDKNIKKAIRLLKQCKERLDSFSSSGSPSGSSSEGPSMQDMFGSVIAKELLKSCIFACLAKFSIMQNGRKLKDRALFLGSRLSFIIPFFDCVRPYIDGQTSNLINSISNVKNQEISSGWQEFPNLHKVVKEKSGTIAEQLQLLQEEHVKSSLIDIISVTSNLVNILAEMRDIESLDKSFCFAPAWREVKNEALQALEGCKALSIFRALIRGSLKLEGDQMQSTYSGLITTISSLMDSYLHDCRSLSFVATGNVDTLKKQISLLNSHIKFMKLLSSIFGTNQNIPNITEEIRNFERRLGVLMGSFFLSF